MQNNKKLIGPQQGFLERNAVCLVARAATLMEGKYMLSNFQLMKN